MLNYFHLTNILPHFNTIFVILECPQKRISGHYVLVLVLGVRRGVSKYENSELWFRAAPSFLLLSLEMYVGGQCHHCSHKLCRLIFGEGRKNTTHRKIKSKNGAFCDFVCCQAVKVIDEAVDF